MVTTKKKRKLDIQMIKRKESKQNTSKHHHQQKLRKKEINPTTVKRVNPKSSCHNIFFLFLPTFYCIYMR